MDKIELGRRITEKLRVDEKEKAQALMTQIINYLSDFYNDHIDIKAKTDDIQLSSSMYTSIFRVFDVTLEINLEDTNIKVTKKAQNHISELDIITVGKDFISCKYGEFDISMVDTYLTEAFQDVF